MILKEKDSQALRLQKLETALNGSSSLTSKKKLETELAILRAGIRGEEEAAYLIDFDLKNNANWIVIHDLRLEWNGRVAQIDHLIVNRLLEVFVVETKNFQTKIRYQNGGWERINFNHWEGIANPVEQNRRHIAVLKELVEAEKLAPQRLGLPMPCDYYNVVAISPKCSIVGQFPKNVLIFKMDDLIKKIRDADPSMTSVFKMVGQQSIEEFCRKIVSYHKPSPLNDIVMPEARKVVESLKEPASGVCEGCRGPVSSQEVFFCRLTKNKSRFAGKLLCRKCQSFAPQEKQKSVPGNRCDICGIEVEAKVVTFCRLNVKRFGAKILCRPCQSSAT